MKTIVERSKWKRGKGEGELLGVDGLMCCLGFRARAGGATEEDIIHESYPSQAPAFFSPAFVEEDDDPFPGDDDDGMYIDTDLTQDMVNTNDSKDMTDAEREAQLTKLFAQAGEEIEFVD